MNNLVFTSIAISKTQIKLCSQQLMIYLTVVTSLRQNWPKLDSFPTRNICQYPTASKNNCPNMI